MTAITDHILQKHQKQLLEYQKLAGCARFNVLPNTLQVALGMGFYGSNDPTNSVEALKEDSVLRIRLQSNQVHLTVLQ